MKKNIGNILLLALEKSVDGFIRIQDLRRNPGKYMYYDGWEQPLKQTTLSQVIQRLREKGMIKSQVNEGRIILKLTSLGEEFLLTNKSEDEIDWDGKWRVVIFDIPENKRIVRDILRNRLKMWGFLPWQKSVWASKKNLTKKLRSLVKELGVEDWVLVIESGNIK